MGSDKFLICVSCMTYNHSLYIEETLNGFCFQQTNFPYVCTIMDDASTDGESKIIKNYVNQHFDIEDKAIVRHEETENYILTFVRHKTNMNCFFAVYYLKYNHYSVNRPKIPYVSEWRENSKYIALCEGDDYWTDSAKLQKQIDFLESHSDYAMCFHAALQHWEDNRLPDQLLRKIEDREYSGPEIFKDWTVATASVVIRREIFHSRIFESALKNSKFIFSDIVLFLSCAANGKVYGMSDVMSVYRRQETGFVFKYSIDRQLKQAYHNYEIYKVFGKDYKKLSVEKFFKDGIEAFMNAKGEGKIYYRLLFDLVRYAPQKTFSFFYNMIRNKI